MDAGYPAGVRTKKNRQQDRRRYKERRQFS